MQFFELNQKPARIGLQSRSVRLISVLSGIELRKLLPACQESIVPISMKREKNEGAKGRPREFDLDSALDKAMRVFWRKGYLGTSLSDLTTAMGISRPSLYGAFGNKEDLFRKAMLRYSEGPAAYVQAAIDEPTARLAVERTLVGIVDLVTNTKNPKGCLWVQGTLSCGDPEDPVRKELSAKRSLSQANLRKRFARAIVEGDLPKDSDAATLAQYVSTIIYGIAVQAANGAKRNELLRVVDAVLSTWPPSTGSR